MSKHSGSQVTGTAAAARNRLLLMFSPLFLCDSFVLKFCACREVRTE